MVVADLLEQGRVLFNEEKYYEAHEVWEDLWRETATPVRLCYQGLIQAAVGLHHLQRGNRAGADGLLRRAVRNLERSSEEHPQHLEVQELTEDLRRLHQEFISGVRVSGATMVLRRRS